jgi:hypothetical protein
MIDYRLFGTNVISEICPNHAGNQKLKLLKIFVEVKVKVYLLLLPATPTREAK